VQEDWLEVTPSALNLSAKAPFQPIASSKAVTFHLLCPHGLLDEARLFLQVYLMARSQTTSVTTFAVSTGKREPAVSRKSLSVSKCYCPTVTLAHVLCIPFACLAHLIHTAILKLPTLPLLPYTGSADCYSQSGISSLITVTANMGNHGFHQRCLRAPGKQEVSSAYCSLMLGSHAAASGFADCAFPYAVAAADSCEDASGGGWLEGMRGSCQQLRQSLFWRGFSESPLCARMSWFLPAQTF